MCRLLLLLKLVLALLTIGFDKPTSEMDEIQENLKLTVGITRSMAGNYNRRQRDV